MPDGQKNSTREKDFRFRRIIVLIALVAVVALFWSNATREYLKTTVLLGMPALVIWGYRRRFITFSWTWWVSTVLLAGLLVGYGIMLQGVPEKLAVKSIERQAGIYVTERKYDLAIEKYRELKGYDRDLRMQRKIREVLVQKDFEAQYQRARVLIKEGKDEEARRILKKIPREAVVYSSALKLMKDLEKD